MASDGLRPGRAAEITALLCRVTADPVLARPVPATPGGQPLDEADVARLLGEPETACRLSADQVARAPGDTEAWARLALALHAGPAAPERTRALRALIHHPELVLAIHTRVSARKDTAPHPVELARWVGEWADAMAGPPGR